MSGESNLQTLISSMRPRLNDGEFVFCTTAAPVLPFSEALMFFRETEGVTIVCTKEIALRSGLNFDTSFEWITLEVHSSLNAVGLTAAFSNALARRGISCNVVAGFYHDHIFVQQGMGAIAIGILQDLAKKNALQPSS